jgi:hypothetical protein
VLRLVPEQALVLARVLARVQALRLVLVLQLVLALVQVRALVQALRLVLVQERCASMRARRCSRARLRA